MDNQQKAFCGRRPAWFIWRLTEGMLGCPKTNVNFERMLIYANLLCLICFNFGEILFTRIASPSGSVNTEFVLKWQPFNFKCNPPLPYTSRSILEHIHGIEYLFHVMCQLSLFDYYA